MLSNLIQKLARIVGLTAIGVGATDYRYNIGDKVIYVNIFGVVWLWEISEQTTYQLHTGEVVRAYHHKNTQTPWYPTLEGELRPATKADLTASDTELQARYGFTPTEWYGCY